MELGLTFSLTAHIAFPDNFIACQELHLGFCVRQIFYKFMCCHPSHEHIVFLPDKVKRFPCLYMLGLQ